MNDSFTRAPVAPRGGAPLSRLGLDPFEAPPATRPEADDRETDALETCSLEDYRAHARPSQKPRAAIHFILSDHAIRSFQYLHLDSDSKYVPGVAGRDALLAFRFTGSEMIDVLIEGRNLRALYDHVTQHRMPWVRELSPDRDFEEDGVPVVNRIALRPVRGDV